MELRAGLPIAVWMSGILELWKQNLDGSNIIVGIIDTSIDNNHPCLRYNSLEQVKISKVTIITEGNLYIPKHGTAVSSILAGWTLDSYRGVAYNSIIYSYVVGNAEGLIDASDIAKGIRACIKDGVHIINISIGAPDENIDLRNAIIEANRVGITIVTSAGNTGVLNRRYPSSYPETISVGSLQTKGGKIFKARSSTSNDRITCSAIGNRTVIAQAGTSSYIISSGTSYATPVITGFCILLIQKYKRDFGTYPNPSTLRTILESYSIDIQELGKDVNTGVGFITAYSTIPIIKLTSDRDVVQ